MAELSIDKFIKFSDRFIAAYLESEKRGGWNWDSVEDVANLACKALGFTGEELVAKMANVHENNVDTVRAGIMELDFTKKSYILLDTDTMSDVEKIVSHAAARVIATHAFNDDNADVDDLNDVYDSFLEFSLQVHNKSSSK